jgi:putative PIN family toxin of toxin-antitoxin system
VRIVLDTVIYVRALINPKGRWGRLALEVAKRHTTITSPEIIREVIEVLQRQELKDRLPEMEYAIRFEAILAALREAEVVEPTDYPPVCRDADDGKFFWCADAASADYIISEDRDIFAVEEYEGSRTISAADFLRLE